MYQHFSFVFEQGSKGIFFVNLNFRFSHLEVSSNYNLFLWIMRGRISFPVFCSFGIDTQPSSLIYRVVLISHLLNSLFCYHCHFCHLASFHICSFELSFVSYPLSIQRPISHHLTLALNWFLFGRICLSSMFMQVLDILLWSSLE